MKSRQQVKTAHSKSALPLPEFTSTKKSTAFELFCEDSKDRLNDAARTQKNGKDVIDVGARRSFASKWFKALPADEREALEDKAARLNSDMDKIEKSASWTDPKIYECVLHFSFRLDAADLILGIKKSSHATFESCRTLSFDLVPADSATPPS